MKKALKIISCLLLILIGGCDTVKSKNNQKEEGAQMTQEEVKQEMLEYLKNKYDVEFVCQSISYTSWAQQGYEDMFVYPKGEDKNMYFPVYRHYQKDGSIRYEDGYVGYLMRFEFQKKIEEIVTEYIKDSTIKTGYNKDVFPETMGIDITYNQFKQYTNKKLSINTSIYTAISKDDAKAVLSPITQALQAEFDIGQVTIHGYTKEDYQKYIVEDFYDTVHTGRSYSDKEQTYTFKNNWGEIDFDYQY